MANRLIKEQSPYLLQHAHNPVDWYPWGDEAFDKAKAENKPLLVSIGYSACHWCHVMEHESFENEDVAAYMNHHFVCVKVDREEHPDVDHMYMDAVQAISSSGGWPLNVFVTPDRAPYYGGTYYPPRPGYGRPSWMQLLGRMAEIWTEQQDEVSAQAEQMLNHLRQASKNMFKEAAEVPDRDTVRKIADTLLKMADKEKGGFGGAPKFPGTMAINFLLEHYHFTGYEPGLKQALLSLDCMIAGGIYDQLGGGFARYSTDKDWLAPHFEKMLYDNALIITSLADAFSITRDERYQKIILDTIAFVENELMDDAGIYYCALDADSEGVEGKYYTWTWDEWLADSFDQEGIAAEYFGIKPEGNWEHTNILHIAKSVEEIATRRGLFPFEIKQVIARVKQNLYTVQKKRIRPQTDDKCLLSWNALMNIALSKAGIALINSGNTSDDGKTIGEDLLDKATRHMEAMLILFKAGGHYMHTWKNGQARISANLDDFAYLIQALLTLASATGNNDLYLKAGELTKQVIAEFSDDAGFFYYTSAGQTDIPVRKVETYDGATPSANSVMAHNLWVAGLVMEQGDWVEQSGRMLRNIADVASRYSYSFGYWAMLIQRKVEVMKTVIISGKDEAAIKREIQSKYLPQAVFITLQKEISELPLLKNYNFDLNNSIFVCEEKACHSPVTSAGEALHLITT